MQKVVKISLYLAQNSQTLNKSLERGRNKEKRAIFFAFPLSPCSTCCTIICPTPPVVPSFVLHYLLYHHLSYTAFRAITCPAPPTVPLNHSRGTCGYYLPPLVYSRGTLDCTCHIGLLTKHSWVALNPVGLLTRRL